MSIGIVFNGSPYTIPVTGEERWGDNVTNYLVAIASGCLQKTGGLFTLTGEVDFGASFGLKSVSYKSAAAIISSAGVLRLANTESIGWRNFANTGNLLLGVNTSNQLTFNGAIISGDISLAPVGSSSNANAATLTGTVLNLEPASASFPGVVTASGTQIFGGDKYLSYMQIGGTTLTKTLVGTGSINVCVGRFTANVAYGPKTGSFIGYSANGTEAAPLATANGDLLTAVGGRGWTGTAFSGTRVSMRLSAVGAWSSTAQGCQINFVVTASGSLTTGTAMIIAHNGNIGIGQGSTVPSSRLSVGSSYQFTVDTTGTVATSSTITGSRLISTVATGTAPLTVTSTTLVNNLYVARSAVADAVSGIITTTVRADFGTGVTITSSDSTVLLTAAAGTIVATLPTAVGISGRQYTIKQTGTGGASYDLATTGGQTIDGAAGYNFSAQYRYVTVQSDGANWVIIANN